MDFLKLFYTFLINHHYFLSIYRIDKYSLSRDVVSTLKKQMTYGSQYNHASCLMTNLQPKEGENHLQLVCRMFLDMFPTISPNEVIFMHY